MMALGRGLLILFAAVFTMPAANAQDADLNKALQSEYLYLVSQKEALIRQRRDSENSFDQRLAKTKSTVTALQKEVARAAAENDERHEALTRLEKFKRDMQKRGGALESTYKRAAAAVRDAERALNFDGAPEKTPIVPPAQLKITDLKPLLQRTADLLRQSAAVEAVDATYINAESRLTQGQVTRVGRVAAFLNEDGQRFLMGPSGSGALTRLEKAEPGDLYLFESLNETAHVRKAATWVERIADLGPLMFLIMMLGLVASLFVVLVRT